MSAELTHYKTIAAATIEMLETMDAGLNQIAASESSLDGEKAKQIAEETLIKVKKIAVRLKPKGEGVNA